MPSLGDFVYVYWDIGTEFGDAGDITGNEFTSQLDAVIQAGYGYLVPKPAGWVGFNTPINPWGNPPASPNAAVTKPEVERLIEAASQVTFGTQPPSSPAPGQPPKLWVKDFGGNKYALVMVTGD